MTAFADLGLSESTLLALQDVGYEHPSPIQEQAIPPMLAGRDLIGQAQTGSGKTAAFGLPILEHVDPSVPEVQALVLTPTRELCIQVTQAIRTYGQRTGADVVAVFGGAPIRSQQAQLRAGGHIVVGTVGRVLDLAQRASLILHTCRFVVLDEADEMLDLGFLEDVERILNMTPNSRQTALFSATMPPPIRALADRYLYDPTHIKVKTATLTVEGPVALEDAVDGAHGRQGGDAAASQFVADGLGAMEAEVAVLLEVLPHLEHQGFQVGVGAAGVVWRLGSVGPIDAAEALASGPSHPTKDSRGADRELESDLVERGSAAHSGDHVATTLR